MKYVVLALAFSSFAFVGCKKSPCDEVKAKFESCLKKLPAETRPMVESTISQISKAGDAACSAFLDDKEKLAMFDEMCK